MSAHPRSSTAWAARGSAAASPVERYAAFRVGYHRGLDAMRANGWRGSGYLRWRHPSNRGVLRCLVGLRDAARAIGEADEVTRLDEFLAMLDPDLPDIDPTAEPTRPAEPSDG
ncbi:MAG: DUF3151 family protein [Microthrixaceae bacterium]